MKKRHLKLARARAKARQRAARRGNAGPTPPSHPVRLALLTGSFACALSVPVHAAGLPTPCPGSASACSGLKWDHLGTHSTNTVNAAGTLMTVNQNANSAIFNWQSFNITPGNSVTFLQPNASSVALNRIYDPNQTTINGNLKANGQLYLINPNGILFGSHAAVDVAGLIASTQNLSDQRAIKGLLFDTNVNNPVFSSDPNMTPTPGNPNALTITVQPGATLYAAGRDNTGSIVSAGRIFLFAPEVSNAGTIVAGGGGQVILAAGSNVYLGTSQDNSLRGLLVEVSGGVKVDNTGTILSDHGNVTMMGLAVNQSGTVAATSAIRENGSIRLVAREVQTSGLQPGSSAPQNFLTGPGFTSPYAQTGQVTLASASKTVVSLDPKDTGTAPLSDPFAGQLRSSITIEGARVDVGGNGAPGATLVQAHGGDVTISARTDITSGVYDYGNPGAPTSALGARIDPNAVVNVNPDALIDVSGLKDVAVDGARNFVHIDRLTSNDLANAPLQKQGFLLGQSVWINLAQPPSFIDVGNRVAALSGTQAERNATAGTISLRAEGFVNIAKAATLDVSGGSVDYSSAIGRTSQLIAADGSVVDITNASADVQYVGFADQLTVSTISPREGIDQSGTFAAPHFTQVGGYTEGKSAGNVEILAPGGSIQGNVVARTITGPYQRSTPPAGGQIRIGSVAAAPAALDSQADLSRGNIYLASDPQAIAQGLSASALAQSFILDTKALLAGGVSRFDLTSDGRIVLSAGSPLNLGPGGSFSARANAVSIGSTITAPGGSVGIAERPLSTVLNEQNPSQENAQREALNLVTDPAQRGEVILAPGTSIDVAGLWTNDTLVPTTSTPTAPVVLNGGSVSISGRRVDVSGSTFDVSAGATLTRSGVFSGGTGGLLSLKGSYQDPSASHDDVDTGTLNLGAGFEQRVAGFGVTRGGSLSITVPGQLWIGSAPAAAPQNTAVLNPSIGARGFASFSFTAFDGAGLGPGVSFKPDIRTFQPNSLLQYAPSATSLLSVATPQPVLPGMPPPASHISLSATDTFGGTVTMGKGTTIDAGPAGTISIAAGQALNLDGTLSAPGGAVSLTLADLVLDASSHDAGGTITPQTAGSRVLDLGPDAVVDVSGISEATVNAQGLRTGALLDAGSVTVDAAAGYLAMQPGARILARGTVDQVDSTATGGAPQRIEVATAGGNVTLQASSGLYVEGQIDAQGGNRSVAGGQLAVRLLAEPTQTEPADVTAFFTGARTLEIDPGAVALPAGQPFDPAAYGARGRVSPSLISSSGFDQVFLGSSDSIKVLQPVSLTVRDSLVLDALSLSAAPGASLHVMAPYVALGAGPVTLSDPRAIKGTVPTATGGTASLTVQAQQIDLIGDSSLQGFGAVELVASGDVRAIGNQATGPRVSGALDFAGNLSIQAAQLYPATQTDFRFLSQAAPTDTSNGRLTVSATPGAAALDPLSAGGSLTFSVGDFSAAGRVVAPLGSIAIDASRSATLEPSAVLSVAGSAIVPYGTVTNGTTWSYTPGSGGVAVGLDPTFWIGSAQGAALPTKGVRINAPNINARPGSTIDLRGGGDTLASDFVPGPGGSFDVSLNFPDPNHPAQPNTLFALLPARGAAFAGYDPQIFGDLAVESAAAGSFRFGQTITIGSGSGIAPGTYTVLPARYALLPGAVAVRPTPGYTDLSPDRSVALADGTVIVAGKVGFGDGGTLPSRWSGFRIYSEAHFRQLAEFHDYLGSAFFPAAAQTAGQVAPRVGPDAGTLAIVAQPTAASPVAIAFNASIDAAPSADGRGAELALSAPSVVVGPGAASTAPSSELDLSAAMLSGLHAESLVIGADAFRNNDKLLRFATFLTLSSPAQSVAIEGPVALSAGEVILAATGTATVGNGATVKADPAHGFSASTTSIQVPGDGAALVVTSAAAPPQLKRAGASPPGTATTGDLAIGDQAVLSGASVLFDASRSQTYSPTMTLAAGNVALSAPQVNFGAAPAGTAGLNLGPSQLAQFGSVGDLTVRSVGPFQIFGAATIGGLDAAGAPTLQGLTLDAPGIVGLGDAAASVVFNAGHLALEDSSGVAAAPGAAGARALTLNAVAGLNGDGTIEIGGPVSVSGFGTLALNAQGRAATPAASVPGTGDVVFKGAVVQPGAVGQPVGLDVGAANLTIGATRITAQQGVDAALTTTGAFALNATGAAPAAQTGELGARLQITASAVDLNGRIDLPAGVLQVNATGTAATDGIALGSASSIRVGGVTQAFASTSADVSAGSIALSTASGSITQQAGGTLDLSGAGTHGDAGALALSAPGGTVTLQGQVLTAPGSSARGASIAIDAAQIGNVSQLAQTIAAGSNGAAAESLSLRARSGNLVVGSSDTLRAHSIELEADGGSGAADGAISVLGTLDASGATGGTVGLYANQQVALGAGALVDAHATGAGQDGGRVTISARVTSNLVSATSLDAITIQTGARIDASSGAGGNGGTITLRANRTGNDIEIAPVPAGALIGARQEIVEPVTVVSQAGPVSLDPASGILAAGSTDLQNFMSAAMNSTTGIGARLGLAGDAAFSLRPGLQIESSGDITVSSTLDFAAGLNTTGAPSTFTWRYGGSTLASSNPGVLTLRSAGNLAIDATVSDGFNPGSAAVWSAGESWSYRFTAGADLQAADPGRTVAGAGDLTIGTGVNGSTTLVRTGTGTIALNAGRDIVLMNAPNQQGGEAALSCNDVYTAGVAGVVAPAFAAGLVPVLTQWGGNLSVNAGRDIVGASVGNPDGSLQYVNDWLYRGGLGTVAAPTVWWTNFATFQQGFGALGGGNLSLNADRDIVRVGAVVPSNAWSVGGVTSERNAGTLDVTAGGAIQQGLYYDQAGVASLRASALTQGSVDTFSDPTLSQVRLAVGSNLLQIQARTGAIVAPPFNPTAYASAVGNFGSVRSGPAYKTEFFTYGPSSALDVRSASGDVVLGVPAAEGAAPGLVTHNRNPGSAGAYAFGSVLPSTVDVTAFGGSISGNPSTGSNLLWLYPAPEGNLRLLAGGDIEKAQFWMSQADVTAAANQVPTISTPISVIGLPLGATPFDWLAVPVRSAVPLHAGDPALAEVVARNGSILDAELNLPKAVEIAASDSITSAADGSVTQLIIQNSMPGDLTTISAGRAIDLGQGTTSSLRVGNNGRIEINGPGAAQILSGGTLDLGVQGDGIISNGNLRNGNLAPQGASLIVIAGAGRDAQGFAQTPAYANVFRQFLQYDAFAAAGADAASLDAQVLSAVKAASDKDATLAPVYQLLQDGMANRASIEDPASNVSAELAALSPAALARGAIKLAQAVQTVANTRFVQTQNKDTFAPGYAVFSDLFPVTADSAAAIRSFVTANPFAASTDASTLRDQALAGLPSALVDAIRLGLAHPEQVGAAGSAFEQALAALDPSVLRDGGRALLASTLQVAGTALDTLIAVKRVTPGSGSPFAKELTAFANAFSASGPRGATDLSMVYSTIKAEQSGDVSVFDPQGGVLVGQSAPPPGAGAKAASDLGIFTLGGGDIVGMARDNFDVYRSRVFTVAGGDILLWSSQENIDAGRGPRDVAVAPAPQIVFNPITGTAELSIGGAVTGSGIGALLTQPNQAPSNIALIAPAGFVDAGEAGIRADTGTVTLGTNLVLNAGNIQAASGVSGGAVVVAPAPPLPASTLTNQADRTVEQMQREAAEQQQEAEQRVAEARRKHVTGEFIGFGND